MWWKGHAILTLIMSVFTFIITGNITFTILFFLSAIVIDIDHYFLYIYLVKDFNIFKAYNLINDIRLGRRYDVHGGKYPVVFHSIEFMIIIFLISLVFPIAIPITLGCYFHILIDLMTINPERFKNIYSLTSYVYKNGFK